MATTEIKETLYRKFGVKEDLLSPSPKVELLLFSQVPPQEGLSEEDRQKLSDPRVEAGESAKTCYGKKLFKPVDYLNPENKDSVDKIVKSTRDSGHLTTRQHVHFTYSLEQVSRQVIWSFLHSHPFYNSEQQSQRYVTMEPGNNFVPDLPPQALEIYNHTTQKQAEAYHKLSEILKEPVEREYLRIFPKRSKEIYFNKRYQEDIQKKAQEVARYVLPIATHSSLHHTISALTLARYARACELSDAPLESKLLVVGMVEPLVERFGISYLEEIPDPLPLEETPEYAFLHSLGDEVNFARAKRANEKFDTKLLGWTSKLKGVTSHADEILPLAVRNVLGVDEESLSDQEAIEFVLNPNVNKLLGDPLNLTTMSKSLRALETVSATFLKKISHTADSQDQRHRMTPGPRPSLAFTYSGEADFITPELIKRTPEAEDVYYEISVESFRAVNELLSLGIPFEKASYLLPNSLALRFVQNGTLLNYHHKDRMRLCFTAQEEIWRASLEEAEQIEDVYPEIGKWLLPPCAIRRRAGLHPTCTEGKNRFCGVPVWNLRKDQYRRLI